MTGTWKRTTPVLESVIDLDGKVLLKDLLVLRDDILEQPTRCDRNAIELLEGKLVLTPPTSSRRLTPHRCSVTNYGTNSSKLL